MGLKHSINNKECKDTSCWCHVYTDTDPVVVGEGVQYDVNEDMRWSFNCMSFEDYKLFSDIDLGVADMVNHPAHYQLEVDGAQIEVTKLIETVLTKEEYIGFLKGNILKYHIRAKNKNGKEDVKKAHFYSKILDELI